MKKLFFLSMSFLLFLTAAAENLLKNGDMENGLESWRIPSWIKNGITPVSDKTVTAGGGSASLKIQGEKGKYGILVNYFKIPAGTKYLQVRLMAKTKNLGTTWASAQVEVENVKKAIFAISTYKRSQNKAETDWMEYVSPVIELPENAGTNARVYLKMAENATGTVWFDDISVTALNSSKEAIPVPAESTPKAAPVQTAPAPKAPDAAIFSKMVPSGESILYPTWDRVVWLRNAAPFTFEKGSLVFRIKPGMNVLTQQRIMGVHANLKGYFRYTVWANVPKGTSPNVSAMVTPIYTIKRAAANYQAKPTGRINGDFREYACSFFAPDDTGEIHVRIGLYGNVKAESSAVFRNMKLEPLTEPGDEIKLLWAENDERQGLFYPDETPFASLKFKNTTNTARELELRCSMRDIRGNVIRKFVKKIMLPAQNISNHKIEFPRPDRLGFFSVHIEWNSLKKPQKQIVSFGMVSKITGKKDPFFGITFIAKCAENAVALNRLGAGTKGLFVHWKHVEQFDGSYDWSAVDRDLQSLEAEGVEPIGGFEVSTTDVPWRYKDEINARLKKKQFPFSEEFFAGAQKFLQELQRRYRGRIKHWALIGEINLLRQRNDYEYAYYIRMAKEFGKAKQIAAPENTLSGCGCSGGDGRALPRYPVLRDLWYNNGLSEVLDGLGIDQYTGPGTYGPGYKPINSETGMIRDIMLEAVRIARSKGANKVVSIDEKGFHIVQSLPVDTPYGTDMAENVARDYITVKSIPEIRHYLYFMWNRWRLGEEFDFGLWLDHFPRQKAVVFAATARIMANARCVKAMSLHSNIPCYLFDNGSQRIIPLWHGGTGKGKAGVTMEIPGNLTILDMEGNPVKPVITDGKLKLQLDSAPIYLQTTDSADQVEKIMKNAVVELPAVRLEMVLKKKDLMEVFVKNLFPTEVKGTLQFKHGSIDFRQNYTVSGNGIGKIQIPLKGFRLEEISGKEFTILNISEQKQVYRITDTFSVHGIPRINAPEELSSKEPLVDLSNGELYLNIPDFISKGVWTGPADCSAKLWMGYDNTNLYMTVKVRDQIHANTKTTESSVWAGDSLQFAFDPNLDAREKLLAGRTGLFDDDFFFTASLSNGKPFMFCHKKGHANADWSGIKPVITRDEAQKTTTYAIVLPWKKLAPLKPEKGAMFGFNFLIMDSDNPAKSPAYWMQLTPGIAGGQTPEKYHIFTLE